MTSDNYLKIAGRLKKIFLATKDTNQSNKETFLLNRGYGEKIVGGGRYKGKILIGKN